MKKHIVVSVIVSVFLFFAMSINVVFGGINDNLIAYFPFEKSADDVGDNNLKGNLINNATFKNGKIGYSLYLDGDGDYVDLGDSFSLASNCSVSVWIKSEDLSREWPAILAKYETNHYGPYDFELHYDKVSVWVSNGNGGHVVIDSNTSITENEWVHIVWVIKDTKATIYVDGEFDIQSDIPLLTHNNDQITIGRQALMFSPYSDLQFKGYIDELRIYSRALSESEIQELYHDENLSDKFCTVNGTIFDTVTGSVIPGVTLTFTSSEFDNEYQANSDGTFNITDIPVGTYQVQISADGYQPEIYDTLSFNAGIPQKMTVSLEQNRPEIINASPDSVEIINNEEVPTIFHADITDPDGITDIQSVSLNLSDINSGLSTITMSLIDASIGRFEAVVIIPADTAPRLYSVSVNARDNLGYTDVKTIEFKVTRKSVETVAPNQIATQQVDNPIDKQSLEICIEIKETVQQRNSGSTRAALENCYVEVRLYQPDGELYGSPYEVKDYIDITIENAMQGQWTYETINYCAESVDVEIETRGANTGILTGTVKDSITRTGVENAQVQWSLGGNATTDEQGFFSIVAVAGSCALVTSADDYQIRLRADVSLSSGKTTTLAIELIPEFFEALPMPDSQLMEKIVNPASKADYLNQPIAAVVDNGNLTISTCFAPYQEPVNIYLGITLDHPNLSSYFFLFNSDDQLNFLMDVLFPWREMTSDWNKVQLFSLPVTALPKANYTFYLLITNDPETLSRYDFRFFTIKIE